jgi:hypothetical protein
MAQGTYGAAELYTISLAVVKGGGGSASGGLSLNVALSWFNKTVTRLAESTWLSFDPAVPVPDLWTVDVLGHAVSPASVVVNGRPSLLTHCTGSVCVVLELIPHKVARVHTSV